MKKIKAFLREDAGLSRGGVVLIQIGSVAGTAIGVIIGRWLS